MQAVVRKANIKDVQDIASIHVRSWNAAFDGLMPAAYIDKFTLARRVKEWQHIIENRKEHVLVAEQKAKCWGLLLLKKK
ncbi:hypothetical protein [Enterovibrio coralii]|uniref:hypothetical protein n=1 Tax=Enterovibrio coralii TaxID=294935 RepID=UPI001E50BA98|nr:hypothetical protein [Enterovibrio coralii]